MRWMYLLFLLCFITIHSQQPAEVIDEPVMTQEAYVKAKNVEDLLKHIDKLERGNTDTKLKYLQQYLLLSNYDLAKKEYSGSYNDQQLFALVKRAHEFVFEFEDEDGYESDESTLKWITYNLKRDPFGPGLLDSIKLVLFAESMYFELHKLDNDYVHIGCNVSGTGAGGRNDLVKLTSWGYTEVHEEYLIEKAIDLMKRKYGQSVYAEERDGVSVLKYDGSFEVMIFLHKDENSAACCPDLAVKCRTQDFETIIPGSVMHLSIKNSEYPNEKSKWKKYK